VNGRVWEETSKGRGRIKAIAIIESQERERKKAESQGRQEVQERQSPVLTGHRLHVNRRAINMREEQQSPWPLSESE
jgi:hypothetical protein